MEGKKCRCGIADGNVLQVCISQAPRELMASSYFGSGKARPVIAAA